MFKIISSTVIAKKTTIRFCHYTYVITTHHNYAIYLWIITYKNIKLSI
jgi:hypothetical protein